MKSRQEATLLEEYRATLRDTKDILEVLIGKLEPYRSIYENEKLSEDVREAAKESASPILDDLAVVRSWASNIEYCVSWLRTGRRPGSVRGIERRAAYEREKSFDPLVMQRFFRSDENLYHWDGEQKENVISSSDKERIEKALSVLTEREKEIYLMAKGNSMSHAKIAAILHLKSRGAVYNTLLRADKKIQKYLREKKKEVNDHEDSATYQEHGNVI